VHKNEVLVLLKLHISKPSSKVSDLVGDGWGPKVDTYKCTVEISGAGRSYLINNELNNAKKLFATVNK
jgi:hypothetical protein